MLGDKLKKALLWIYIAQYVKRHVINGIEYAKGDPAGVYEEDCKKYCREYESLPKKYRDKYLDIGMRGHRYGSFVRTTISGTSEGKRIVNELLSQHNDKLQELLKSIPMRLLAFFVKEVFSSSDGLLIKEKEDYVWGYFDVNLKDYIEHQCLLNDNRIKNKRDEFLNRLVELNLAVKNVTTYSIGKEKRDIQDHGAGDKVYCIAPEVLDYLKSYVQKNFSENIFSEQLEQIHLKCHPENIFRSEVDVNFLNPLVEYLLEEKLPESAEESIRLELPPPEPIQPDVYFQNNTWKVFYNFLADAESSIDICADTITADALSIIFHLLKKKDVLKSTRLMARSIQGVKEILRLGIPPENITQCKKLHAKFIVKDKKALLVTSCNVTLGALGDLGKRPGSYEATLITEDKGCVNNAQLLFNGIWDEKAEMPELNADSPLISSVHGIPSKIKDLIKNAKKGITIAIPPLFEDVTESRKTIIEHIRELNPKVPLSIYINNSIPKSSWDCYKKISDLNIDLRLISELLHSKVYLFDDEIAFISSLNLSYASWVESLEVGVLTKDKNHIKKIKEVLTKLTIVNNAEMKGISAKENMIDEPARGNIRRIEIEFETEGKKIALYRELRRTQRSKPQRATRIGVRVQSSPEYEKRLPCPPPTAKVKTPKGGFRIGRGFSYLELLKAKIQIGQAKKMNAPIDKRRKTCYAENIKTLLVTWNSHVESRKAKKEETL